MNVHADSNSQRVVHYRVMDEERCWKERQHAGRPVTLEYEMLRVVVLGAWLLMPLHTSSQAANLQRRRLSCTARQDSIDVVCILTVAVC